MEQDKRDNGREEEAVKKAVGLDRATQKPGTEDDLPVAGHEAGSRGASDAVATTEVEEEMPDSQSGLVDAGETGAGGAARGQGAEG